MASGQWLPDMRARAGGGADALGGVVGGAARLVEVAEVEASGAEAVVILTLILILALTPALTLTLALALTLTLTLAVTLARCATTSAPTSSRRSPSTRR